MMDRESVKNIEVDLSKKWIASTLREAQALMESYNTVTGLNPAHLLVTMMSAWVAVAASLGSFVCHTRKEGVPLESFMEQILNRYIDALREGFALEARQLKEKEASDGR